MEKTSKYNTGRYLTEQDRASLKRERQQRLRGKRKKKLLSGLILIMGNVLLLYMINSSRIDPCYGAGFAAVSSAYLGYQMHL
jgi:hypothetical protein